MTDFVVLYSVGSAIVFGCILIGWKIAKTKKKKSEARDKELE